MIILNCIDVSDVKNIEIIRIIHLSFTIIINLSHHIKVSFDIAILRKTLLNISISIHEILLKLEVFYKSFYKIPSKKRFLY